MMNILRKISPSAFCCQNAVLLLITEERVVQQDEEEPNMNVPAALSPHRFFSTSVISHCRRRRRNLFS